MRDAIVARGRDATTPNAPERMRRAARAVARSDVRGWAEHFLQVLGDAVPRRREPAEPRPPITAFDDPAAVADEVAGSPRRRSSASTSTACSRPSPATPPTPRCCPGCSTASPARRPHARRRGVGPIGDDLARFGFPASIMVVGSHGAERRGLPLPPLDPVESTRLDRLRVPRRSRRRSTPAPGRGSRRSRPASCSTSARPTPTRCRPRRRGASHRRAARRRGQREARPRGRRARLPGRRARRPLARDVGRARAPRRSPTSATT